MKKNFFLVFFLVFFFSCKEKNNNSINENIQIENKEKSFTVEIALKSYEEDVMCLYYKDNSITFFNEDMGIYKNISKSEGFQNISFELPENVNPNDFRFDLSHQNPKQKLIIEKITFTKGDKSFKIEGDKISKYLEPNYGVIFNEDDNTFTFRDNEDGSYDPYLSTNGNFYPLLETLVGYTAFEAPKQ